MTLSLGDGEKVPSDGERNEARWSVNGGSEGAQLFKVWLCWAPTGVCWTRLALSESSTGEAVGDLLTPGSHPVFLVSRWATGQGP